MSSVRNQNNSVMINKYYVKDRYMYEEMWLAQNAVNKKYVSNFNNLKRRFSNMDDAKHNISYPFYSAEYIQLWALSLDKEYKTAICNKGNTIAGL